MSRIRSKDTTLTFGETDNCLSVAQMLCDEFKVEMDIEYSADTDVRTLNFIDKVGTTDVIPMRTRVISMTRKC